MKFSKKFFKGMKTNNLISRILRESSKNLMEHAHLPSRQTFVDKIKFFAALRCLLLSLPRSPHCPAACEVIRKNFWLVCGEAEGYGSTYVDRHRWCFTFTLWRTGLGSFCPHIWRGQEDERKQQINVR